MSTIAAFAPLLVAPILMFATALPSTSAPESDTLECHRLGVEAAEHGSGRLVAGVGGFFGSFIMTVVGLETLSDDSNAMLAIGLGAGSTLAIVGLAVRGETPPPADFADATESCQLEFEHGYRNESRANRQGAAILGGALGIAAAFLIAEISWGSATFSPNHAR